MRYAYKGKRFLWLLALSIPPGIAGFILNTLYSFLWGIIGFVLCGLAGPFIYYLIKREDLGGSEGPYHGAAHLAAWSALSVFLLMAVWYFLDVFQEIWEKGMVFAALSIPVMATAVFISMLLDDIVARAYVSLRRKNKNIAHWLACCYFIGLLPAAVIVAVLFIYFRQGTQLDPYTALFFVSAVLEKSFLLKIFLAMVSFAIYLYFALDGTKGKRVTQVIFTALIYLMLIYIPIIVSLRLPIEGEWRAYADPAYISLFPVLSDLWSVGLAMSIGGHVAKWIFK